MTAEGNLEVMNVPDKPVLISGMFDMCNFGDLLFPLVAAYRLGLHGLRVIPLSPTGATVGLADALPSMAIEAVLVERQPARGILLGGGYIIHNHPMHFLDQYESAALADWIGAGMWLGATMAAALQDIPVAWNAPGVPHPFARGQRPIIDAALRAADYVSLRDEGSRDLLAPPDDVALSIVPDPIADLARMWPASRLEAPFRDFLARKGASRGQRFAAVHVRNRSLAGIGSGGMAAALDSFARQQGVCPILIAVGQSHEDDVTARDISRQMQVRHLVLDDPVSLVEIAAVIGNSAVYAGASLHGYVAAAAYGVPAVLVALPAYRKFAGFLDHTGRRADLAHDWKSAIGLAVERLAGDPGLGIPSAVSAALDRHWDSVVNALSDPSRRRRERADFMRTCLRIGVARNGPRWLHQPMMRRDHSRDGAVPIAAGRR
ncbi:polysaccharide pyruvyl transferase family protein [Reyranella sp.]|uniref:polysaccharide pyruvyl transferase family protein n=1 Tax=Reyranella sp. TaxID=1929291 RepID=UPI003BADAD92